MICLKRLFGSFLTFRCSCLSISTPFFFSFFFFRLIFASITKQVGSCSVLAISLQVEGCSGTADSSLCTSKDRYGYASPNGAKCLVLSRQGCKYFLLFYFYFLNNVNYNFFKHIINIRQTFFYVLMSRAAIRIRDSGGARRDRIFLAH